MLYHSSRTSAYLKRLTKVQSFKGKGLVSRKMIDVIRSVPPVEITSDMKKIKGVSRRTLRNNSLGLFLPKIIYPEDEWRERLRVEVGRSPFRMALYAPRSFYDSSEDLMGISAKGQEEGTNWIERALDKQTEFMEMGEGSVSPEEAFEKAKTWLLSELEAHHATNFIPKETLDSYYKDVVESESRIVKLNALPEEDDLRGKSVLPDEDGGIGENDEILNLLEDGIAGDNLDLAEMKKMFKDSESSKVSNE